MLHGTSGARQRDGTHYYSGGDTSLQRWLQHGGSTVILQSLCCCSQADCSVQNKQKAQKMRSKGVTKVFYFHQHEMLPGWISAFSLDVLLGSPLLWHAQIGGLPRPPPPFICHRDKMQK